MSDCRCKVLVVDDHPLARRGVASLLAEAFPALELREAGHHREAITIATSFQPNLVVLDLRTPDPPGPAATCASPEGAQQQRPHRHPDRRSPRWT